LADKGCNRLQVKYLWRNEKGVFPVHRSLGEGGRGSVLCFRLPAKTVFRPLWREQAVQVSNDQGLAKIRKNSHFSVDISPIKAYYLIVKMGKARAASDAAEAKEAKAEN
jgi:hypothetical protein